MYIYIETIYIEIHILYIVCTYQYICLFMQIRASIYTQRPGGPPVYMCLSAHAGHASEGPSCQPCQPCQPCRPHQSSCGGGGSSRGRFHGLPPSPSMFEQAQLPVGRVYLAAAARACTVKQAARRAALLCTCTDTQATFHIYTGTAATQRAAQTQDAIYTKGT